MLKKMILLLAIATVTGFNCQAQESNQDAVTVTGKGTVYVVPDKVVINSRIEHSGKSAVEVKKKNDEAVNSVIKFLKNNGVPEKNINTDYLNLNKNYDYNDKTYSYVANQAISITLEDIEEYEKMMSGLLENGLNRIDGVAFKSSVRDEREKEARKMAVLDAKSKAEELVAPLGQSIGKAISITEVTTNNVQPLYKMVAMNDAEGGTRETIAPGEMEITVKVNVAFHLK